MLTMKIGPTRGFGILETLVAAFMLAVISMAFVSFYGKTKRSEDVSTGFTNQTLMVFNIQQRIASRQNFLENLDASTRNCMAGKGCIAGTKPLAVTIGGEKVSGTAQNQAALYTNQGVPCNLIGQPNRDCEIGVWSEVVVTCVGRCERPTRVHVRTYVEMKSRHGPSTILSSEIFGDTDIGPRDFLLGACDNSAVESSPDPYDSVSVRVGNLSGFDQSVFFGYEQGLPADFSNINNRDNSNYCRKVRLTPRTCNLADGAVAIGINPDGSLICTERVGFSGVIGGAVGPMPPSGTVVLKNQCTPYDCGMGCLTCGPHCFATAVPNNDPIACMMAGKAFCPATWVATWTGPNLAWTLGLAGNWVCPPGTHQVNAAILVPGACNITYYECAVN